MIGLILKSRAAVAVLLLAGAPVWCGCPMLMGAEPAAPATQTSQTGPCGGGCATERDLPENRSDLCDCDHPAPEQMVMLGGKQAAADLERPAPAPAWAFLGRPAISRSAFAPPAFGLNTSPPRGDRSLLSLHTMLTT